MSTYILVITLGLFTSNALAGCIPSKLAPCEVGVQWLNKCPKGIPKKWACLDPKIDFPTVDCIAADIEACGTLAANPALFYSFGATTIEVRTKIRDTLTPRPVMFNDALPKDWDNKISAEPRFGLTQGKIADPGFQKRYDAYVNRFSAAMAKAAKGEVIIVTQTRTSRNQGEGAYSKPDPQTPAENRWRVYEFPIAQRNPKVTSVVSYALQENPLKKVVDFQPNGAKGELLPMPSFPNPPKPVSPQQPATPPASTPTPRPATPGSPKPRPSTPKPAPVSPKPKPSPPKPAPAPPKKPVKKPTRKTRAARRAEMLRDSRM
ncbi:hypothetical protein C7974DRAFT_384737 [Boeremia exigua]|uniref:uncharacterized protein n=1 Tax=Boeremia exigua TaxID=749465 RepID=UPI001E8D0D95|nr:uncharacterized protein C7974DRAFT_384737 [Boeremia exigua]KAH6642048.1 hypothetical protein C7974DRAFT_384737 [Boeremia exigua]